MVEYTALDVQAALHALPLVAGDTVFCHSNMGYFGRLRGVSSGDELCALVVDAVLDRIGPNGTLIVPTFTYSFPRGLVYDPIETPSGMGMFAEWIRKHPDARRSLDPCYSVAAIGSRAEELTRDAPENSFGPNSFFQRFHAVGGAILNFNFDAGSTFVHYVERNLGVCYRFDKSFEGRIKENGIERLARNTIWVRYMSDDSLAPAFERFDLLARECGHFVTSRLGRGEVGVIRASDCYDLIKRTLPERPWFLTRAEAQGINKPVIDPTKG